MNAMLRGSSPNRPMRIFSILVLSVALLVQAGCAETLVNITPEHPRQGDTIEIVVDNTDRSSVDHIEITYAGQTERANSVPETFLLDTCKDTEPYMTGLDIRVETTYDDGFVGNAERQLDLTRSVASRENDSLDFNVYITQDSDDSFRGHAADMASAFRDEFDADIAGQSEPADPSHYTSGVDANGADLTLSLGHGLPHMFYTGVGAVDVSTTAYGSFHPCNGNGDAEYLAFFSCLTLSLEDQDGLGWRHFWRNVQATEGDLRPFSGLHMALGFRTEGLTRCFFGCDGEDMMEEFAANLDSGDRVVDAWQEAVGDELTFWKDYNRGTVIYLPVYEDDTIYSASDDFIYGHPEYRLHADYWN